MKYTRKDALTWIAQQKTAFCRTPGEAAKYLIAKLTVAEMPHIALWWEVIKIANGMEDNNETTT